MAKIILKDEVNCKIEGLDLETRKKLANKFSFMLPYAYHVPAYKLGRWDGKVNYFNIGGTTYTNLLEDILPILISEGYEVDIDDRRNEIKLDFPQSPEWGFEIKLEDGEYNLYHKNKIISNKIEILIGTVKVEDFDKSTDQINSESHPNLLLNFDFHQLLKI